jgi:hypothetical protein
MPPSGPTGPAAVGGGPNQGVQMRGMIMIGLALKAIEQAIPLVGSTSEQGKVAVEALAKLSKAFGTPSQELMKSEVKMLGESAGTMDKPGPEQMAAFQQRIQGGLKGMPMGMPETPQPAPGVPA